MRSLLVTLPVVLSPPLACAGFQDVSVSRSGNSVELRSGRLVAAFGTDPWRLELREAPAEAWNKNREGPV